MLFAHVQAERHCLYLVFHHVMQSAELLVPWFRFPTAML